MDTISLDELKTLFECKFGEVYQGFTHSPPNGAGSFEKAGSYKHLAPNGAKGGLPHIGR
jgi:hypothetical protein